MSVYQKIFLGVLKNRPFTGSLHITYQDKTYSFGNGEGMTVQLDVQDSRFFQKIIRFGDIGLGESYFLGYFTSPDLEKLLTWFVINGKHLPQFKGSTAFSYAIHRGKILSRWVHAFRRNTKQGSKKNISSHYDISNAFYKLWLDSTMTYSSALFEEGMSLQQAQENKYKTICEKINLQKSDQLLEIGSGRGGFSIYAAQQYGCKITTVTISEQQYAYAAQKIKDLGLQDSIEIKFLDYRDIEGSYDKIVSIEMMEALGHEYVPTYIQKCNSVLKPGGVICYQVISIPDEHFATYLRNSDYIQAHIFPGAELLSVGQITDEAHKTGELSVADITYFGASYAKTLHARLDSLRKERSAVLALGYDEIFIRKWEYYLIYCAVGFATSYINVAQIKIEKK